MRSLDRRARRTVDDPAQLGDLLAVEGAARGLSSRRFASAVRPVQRLERQRDQHRALALDEVVAGRLAGRRRVAEHAEQVVAQLERLAERQPERGSAASITSADAPARAAPMCSGRSMEYFADL